MYDDMIKYYSYGCLWHTENINFINSCHDLLVKSIKDVVEILWRKEDEEETNEEKNELNYTKNYLPQHEVISW